VKGAGIRVYEYASSHAVAECRLQLEALFWLCKDADDVAVANGMAGDATATRRAATLDQCRKSGLLDAPRLVAARVLNTQRRTICPLCLEELSGQGFFNRMKQAEGRLVPDLTVTELNLFHVSELRTGELNHRPYNVGWGHHHCNVAVRDIGVSRTLEWMQAILQRNVAEGYFGAEKRES